MRPINDPIIVVDSKGRRHPIGLGRVAAFTIGRQTQSNVVRINTLVIIRLVTADASGWRIVVISIMTAHTIIGYRQMRTIEYPIIVMVGEQGWVPTRIGCMAAFAIGR